MKVLITREQIAQRLAQLAHELRREYEGKHPLLVAVLKGSFVFLADLVRALDFPLEVDFVKLSSYGAGRKETSGKVRTVQGLSTPPRGRHVLVVEDIVDTGLTIRFLLDRLRRQRPASLKLCALLDKPSRRTAEVPIDYLGFSVEDIFIVGYGLDFDEKFRYLPDVCGIVEER